MKLVKRIFFETISEKIKLNKLTEESKSENTLALKIEKEFNLDFNESFIIAQYWFNLKKK